MGDKRPSFRERLFSRRRVHEMNVEDSTPEELPPSYSFGEVHTFGSGRQHVAERKTADLEGSRLDPSPISVSKESRPASTTPLASEDAQTMGLWSLQGSGPTSAIGESDQAVPDAQPSLPPTARYILGLEEEPASFMQSWEGWRHDFPDPAPLELELTCILCFCFESACECATGKATTALRMSELPLTKRPYGTLPTPIDLIQLIGMRATHLASGVAQTFWPVISLGLVPIFDQRSLVLVGSRALERAKDAKEVLVKMAKLSRSEETKCCCGCREVICARVALRHGLYKDSGALERATSINYTFGTDTITAVTLGNGTTCLSGRFSQNLDVFDVPTEFVEDYLLAAALNPLGRQQHFLSTAVERTRMASWDGILNSWVADTLRRSRHRWVEFQQVALRTSSRHPEGERLVVRSESFGAGTGLMVLDLEPDGVVTAPYGAVWASLGETSQPSLLGRSSNDGWLKYRDCTVAPVGKGWNHIEFDSDSRHFRLGLTSSGADLTAPVGISGRPRRGYNCTTKCKGGVMAYCCGFSAPTSNPKKTTVYILGPNPVAYLAVSQFSQEHGRILYLVDHRACLGCTVLQAPPGSIVDAD